MTLPIKYVHITKKIILTETIKMFNFPFEDAVGANLSVIRR